MKLLFQYNFNYKNLSIKEFKLQIISASKVNVEFYSRFYYLAMQASGKRLQSKLSWMKS